jgi:hypothetical protein
MNKILGKKSPRFDKRTLHFSKYTQTLISPPDTVNWTKAVPSWPMLKNDVIGDCTIAAALHQIESWSYNAGVPFIPTDGEALAAYEAVSGYDPKTGANDNGAVLLDVLKYWKKNGIANHKIIAYVALEPNNHIQLKQSIDLLGTAYIGLALPLAAQNQEGVWHMTQVGTKGQGAPESWGGHAVNIVGYDDNGLTLITWGRTWRMTWRFYENYCDESYGILSQDWIEKNNKAPNGFDLQTLEQDLLAL